jgi:pantoate--beta-alanine ligase
MNTTAITTTLLSTVVETQTFADQVRMQGKRIALVPTMGALHEGHLTLVREAKKYADVVMVSIFVNPTQFGPNEDFSRYPRTLEADLALLAPLDVDAVFVPSVDEMYPKHDRTWVNVEQLDTHLCGATRPGHFRGVTTVVTRLFLICRPHVAVFGLKDAQQFLILRRMNKDLHFGIELVGVETVRESDGLAMSSRNRYLSEEERGEAVVVSQAVFEARARIEMGEKNVGTIIEGMHAKIAESSVAKIQYAEVVETDTLQPIETVEKGQEVLVAIAVYFGKTRLIDNQFVKADV